MNISKKLIYVIITLFIIVSVNNIINKVKSKNTNLNSENIENQDSIQIIKNKFYNELSDFNSKVQNDSRKSLLEKLLNNYDFIYSSDLDKVNSQLNDLDKYYVWINEGNQKIFDETIKKLEKLKINNLNKKNEIENFINQLSLSKGNSNIAWTSTFMIILEMKSVIKTLNSCDKKILDKKIVFDNKTCQKQFEEGIASLNKAINSLENFKKTIKSP